MKVTEFKRELEKSSLLQLHEKLEELRRELFSLKLNAQTSHVKDNAKFQQLRKDIARVSTFINKAQQSNVSQ